MKREIAAFLMGGMLAFLAAGCSDEQKQPAPVPPRTTEAPSTPAAVLPMEVEIEIPISENYFGDERFCTYLKENFDRDGNGFFSKEELMLVTEIKLKSSKYMITPYTELKGFSYFSELEHLELESVDSVVLCDVPKLKHVMFLSRYAVRVGKVVIESCPELCSIYMSEVIFQSTGKEDENVFVVKDCPNFREVNVYDSDFSRAVVDFTDAPPGLEVRFDDVVLPVTLKLDSSAFFFINPEMVCSVKEKTVSVPEEVEIVWRDGDAPFPAEKGLTELGKVIQQVTESFYVQLKETESLECDEYGRRAYAVTIESSVVNAEGYEFYLNQDIKKAYKTYLEHVIVYCNEQTREEAEERFSIKWEESAETTVTYSAACGMSGSYRLSGRLYDVTEEAELGYVLLRLNYSIDETGQLKTAY